LKPFLKKLIRNILAELAGVTALVYWFLSFKAFYFYKGKILSVYFHNPSQGLFRVICLFLKLLGFEFIALSDLKKHLFEGEKIPNKSVIITFDDAWKNNINLLPFIEKHQLNICLFVPTEAIDTGEFWWKKVERSIHQGANREISRLKAVSNFERLKFIANLSSAGTGNSRDTLTWVELKKLLISNYVTIGSHTKTHPLLDKCSAIEIEEEFIASKKRLEEELKIDVYSLAYPNGNVNSEVMKLAKTAGYQIAFTTKPGLISTQESPLLLPRFSINDSGLFFENLAKSVGAWQQLFGTNDD
jgi:peptidoglycan/xylan/chitin deacetylase (PgdA/CDA1 family)